MPRGWMAYVGTWLAFLPVLTLALGVLIRTIVAIAGL